MFLIRCIFALVCSNVFALQFHNSEETLNKIFDIIAKEEKGVYLRFGDGDVVLANGHDDGFQKNNAALQREMREAFALNGPNVLKCLPLGCREFGGWELGMVPGNHEQSYDWCKEMIDLAAPFWNGEMGEVYSMTALAYCSTHRIDHCIQFLQGLKKSKCALFVGNGNIPAPIRELLFGRQCQFVPTPAQNSYDQIDRIERECLDKIRAIDGYKIIVTSMGCSGRALQKRLWKQLDDVFLFDFGSLMDAICGWSTRDWISITRFDRQQFMAMLEQGLRPGVIRVVCTSALLDVCAELRKQEYISVLELLREYGYAPYVFEACHPVSPSFLEEYAPHVFYSNVNDPQIHNKGVNEVKSMMAGFKRYRFNDNDMIVKLTGRYRFDSPDFLHLVEAHPEIDVFVKCEPGWGHPKGKAFTGCFAMRHKLFKEMLRQLDLIKMERYEIDLEREVADFINQLPNLDRRVMYLEKIGMWANIGGSCPPILSYW
ncbi:MAG TPA: GT-D fold domain-containing glycosyltransferase [Chlamydiales bacterium]|nr:GT-D fold domain-containing glycosyltransferase [Chlamydiales bacterium]